MGFVAKELSLHHQHHRPAVDVGVSVLCRPGTHAILRPAVHGAARETAGGVVVQGEHVHHRPAHDRDDRDDDLPFASVVGAAAQQTLPRQLWPPKGIGRRRKLLGAAPDTLSDYGRLRGVHRDGQPGHQLVRLAEDGVDVARVWLWLLLHDTLLVPRRNASADVQAGRLGARRPAAAIAATQA